MGNFEALQLSIELKFNHRKREKSQSTPSENISPFLEPGRTNLTPRARQKDPKRKILRSDRFVPPSCYSIIIRERIRGGGRNRDNPLNKPANENNNNPPPPVWRVSQAKKVGGIEEKWKRSAVRQPPPSPCFHPFRSQRVPDKWRGPRNEYIPGT